MIVALLGPQGSGKSTQAKLLASSLNSEYLDIGGHLRKLSINDKDLDKIVNKSGILVPDNQMFKIITKFLGNKDLHNLVIDGYPRSINQYAKFTNWLAKRGKKIDVIFNLELEQKESIKRLMSRNRVDDNPKAIKTRLDFYNKDTGPLVSKLKSQNKIININADQTEEKIHSEVVSKL